MAVVNKLDIFEKVCRTCNNQSTNLLNIFDVEPLRRIKISEMLTFCSQCPVSSDDLYPQQICYFCVKKLEISFKFLKQCQQANAEFDKVLNYYDEKETNTDKNVEETKLLINESPTMVEKADSHEDEEVGNFTSKRNEYCDGGEADGGCAYDTKSIQMPTDHSTRQLKEHGTLDKVRNGNKPRVVCDYCTKSFLTTKALQLHTKLLHKK